MATAMASNESQDADNVVDDEVSPFDDFTTRLKVGIDINSLQEQAGADFEFDEDDIEATKKLLEDNSNYFDNEKSLQDNMSSTWEAMGGEVDEDEQSDTSANDSGEVDIEDIGVFTKIGKHMESVSGKDRGVLKKVLKEGVGASIPPGAYVTIHYNAFLELGDEPYDSSRLRNETTSFHLGTSDSEAILGVDIAVKSMKKGELSRFLIKPDYAYGKMGVPPRIPEDATLMFEIEVLNWVDDASVHAFEKLTMEEKRNVTFKELLKYVVALGEFARKFFKSAKWRQAEYKYRKAIRTLEKYNMKDEAEEIRWRKEIVRFSVNAALCTLKSGHYHETVKYCKTVVEFGPRDVDKEKYAKALYLYGKALHKIGDFRHARQKLCKAREFKPHDPMINNELKELEITVRKFKEIEKETCKKMFVSRKSDDDTQTTQISSTENKENEDLFLRCSSEFKDSISKKLKEFHENSSLEEMPFPGWTLADYEIGYIMQSAEYLGLDVIKKGEGTNITMKIVKPKKIELP